jgi:hypothetical protein
MVAGNLLPISMQSVTNRAPRPLPGWFADQQGKQLSKQQPLQLSVAKLALQQELRAGQQGGSRSFSPTSPVQPNRPASATVASTHHVTWPRVGQPDLRRLDSAEGLSNDGGDLPSSLSLRVRKSSIARGIPSDDQKTSLVISSQSTASAHSAQSPLSAGAGSQTAGSSVSSPPALLQSPQTLHLRSDNGIESSDVKTHLANLTTPELSQTKSTDDEDDENGDEGDCNENAGMQD